MLKTLDMCIAISGRNNDHPKVLHRVFLINEYDTVNIMNAYCLKTQLVYMQNQLKDALICG